jgi:hypothetical protein
MCGGVIFEYQGQLLTIYFPNPKAVLPVKLANGQCELLSWGRRQGQAGTLPLGGWARLESIQQGSWQRYFPKPVKLPILKFMEKDIVSNSHWFDIMEGNWIQGLLVQTAQERRVYVVTIEPQMSDAVHTRWPRILTG